jgi:hypothetical protein
MSFDRKKMEKGSFDRNLTQLKSHLTFETNFSVKKPFGQTTFGLNVHLSKKAMEQMTFRPNNVSVK